jgi:thioredoxin reductase (NADPH)
MDQEVALVGAGNSAGQAVVFLAGHARKVWMVVRGPDLEATMSRYLIERIASLPNVQLVTEAEVVGLDGAAGDLEAIIWRARRTGVQTRTAMSHLFLFIGAEPNTDWLAGSPLALDDKGFVLTGADVGASARPLETSLPGVFAIGDVRSGSTKRVAAGVGEGAQVVAALHAYLADTAQSPAATAIGSGR